MAFSQEMLDVIPSNSESDHRMTHPPQYLLSWLTYTGYMSERLRDKSGEAVLQVIQQTWEPTNTWDHQVLSLPDEQVLHRDIVTLAWEQPCWFARTIFPQTTYQTHLDLFHRLDHEPLGNLIFHTESIKRLNLCHYPITAESPEYAWLPKTIDTHQQVLWVRLSTFQVQDAELFYLVEILLPALEQYS